MKEILKNMVQKIHKECNRRERKRKLMSMVAMLCVFSIVTTSVMQSSMIPVSANYRTGSNAVYTSSNVATPSNTDDGSSSGGTSVVTPSDTDVETPSNAQVATPSNPTFAGILVCGIDDEDHVHEQSCYCEDEAVADVILRIHALPTADEVDATLLAYEEAEDWEAYEEYFVYMGNKGRKAYEKYEALTDEQKELVFNIDKLMEWSYLWSVVPLIEEIESDTPTTVNAASTSDFITLNLYDYGSNINDKWNSNKNLSGFQWNGGAYMTSSAFSRTRVDNIDFGNSMITDYDYVGTNTGITNGRSSNRKNVINQGGAINRGISYTNEPIGLSMSGYEAMSTKLSADGYPVLATGDKLDWLFKGGTYAKKQNTANIDGLFQHNATTGEYFYDSRDNHAQYGNDRFTLYNQIITPNFIIYPFGNFLPLNEINNKENATQINKITSIGDYVQNIINDLVYENKYANNTSAKQLIDMLARYRTNLQNSGVWDSWSAKNVINEYLTTQGYSGTLTNDLYNKLYNIDWDIDTNFFFGMEMRMNFMQPKNGMTGTNDAYPMKFYFAGDDDVWVYIDNTLFLDLSGIHRHVGGDIDFKNGVVNYYKFKTYVDGEIESTPYFTLTFADILTKYGNVQQADLGKYLKYENGKYTTFLDYSTHKFDFFYMERGSGSSVCRINFNFPLLKQNTISVEKELTTDGDANVLGNPNFEFQVLKANTNGKKTDKLFIGAGTSYDVYEGDKKVGTGKTDANGVISIKKGQRAEFSGINENAGKFYVRELLTEDAFKQYGKITVSGSSTTKNEGVTIGSDSFIGVDSPVKDASDGATAFHFNNQITFDKLGHLEIQKIFNPYSDFVSTIPTEPFEFIVKLSGTKIPVGTKYSIDGIEYTVENKGIIKVPAGKKATISNIVAGTTFEIEETSDSSANFEVVYSGVKGTIQTDKVSSATITNIELGAKVFIPLEKVLTNADGNVHSYSFKLAEVDAAGNESTNGYQSELNVTFDANDIGNEKIFKNADGSNLGFTIYYLSKDVPSTGATYYYKVYENASDTAFLDSDQSIYLVTVTVTKDASNYKITANSEIKIGSSTVSTVSFTNTLLSSVTIQKEVTGSLGDRSKQFDFTATAEVGTFVGGNIEISGGCEFEVNDEGSQITFKLAHGNELTINKLPVGTKITVTENYTQGENETIAYVVTAKQGNTTGTGSQITSTIAASNETIVFTNHKEARPDTGILLDSWPYLLILVIALAGIVGFVIHKRKETDLD